MTGPTWPARGSVNVGGESVRYRLLRSFAGAGDAPVSIQVPSRDVKGSVEFRRHATQDAWTRLEMARDGESLVARLPHQPPAGKLDYQVALEKGPGVVLLGEPVTIRFRGDVPAWVLIPHVLAMFLGMLWATRAGLEKFSRSPDYGSLILWTLLLLGIGGLLLGPAVQKFSFDAWWTGWPFGGDLTDNKTAIAWLAWLAAWIVNRRRARSTGWWALAAALITWIIFRHPAQHVRQRTTLPVATWKSKSAPKPKRSRSRASTLSGPATVSRLCPNRNLNSAEPFGRSSRNRV